MIGMAVLLGSAVLVTAVQAAAPIGKGSGPNESALAYLNLLEVQNLLVGAAHR